MLKNALTIAGSDSSGGAGVQADMKSFIANGCYAMSVITAITAQNTQGVFAVQDIDPEIIEAQINAVFDDIKVDVVKIGMVSVPATISIIAKRLTHYQAKPIVLDPVMISKSGYDLLQPEAKESLKKKLLPLATVITPNIPEAEELTGLKIESIADMEVACHKLADIGVKAILIKGGHRIEDATDVFFDGKDITYFPAKRVDTKNTHGTGCSLSSALAAQLTTGKSLTDAVKAAKEYVYNGILHAEDLGHGWGPINHFYKFYGSDKTNIFP